MQVSQPAQPASSLLPRPRPANEGKRKSRQRRQEQRVGIICSIFACCPRRLPQATVRSSGHQAQVPDLNQDVVSATAYAGFIASPFQAWMDKLRKEFPEDSRCANLQDGLEKLLALRGSRVEEKLLTWFRAKGSRWTVLDLSKAVSELRIAGKSAGNRWHQACADKTLEGLKAADVNVIYQAPVFDARLGFFGIVDFLIRGEDGDYAIWDTKLATHPTAYHVAQLIGYAVALESMLAPAGGLRVTKVGLVLGEDAAEQGVVKEISIAELKRPFFESWWAFRDFCNTFRPDLPPDPADEPKASLGRWAPAAEEMLTMRDDLALVASMTRAQRAALKLAGYKTMTSISQMPPSALASVSAVSRIKPHTLERLVLQARLQCQTRDNTHVAPASVILPNAARVLAALPADDSGDIFIDLESLPWNKPPAAAEYLIGICTRDGTYHSWWSHTRDEELENTGHVLNFIFDRLQQFPNMHAYCYGHYERSALSRLAAGLPEDFKQMADELIKTVLIDLYPILKGSFVLGLPGYGLKQVERLFRTGEQRCCIKHHKAKAKDVE